MEKNSHQCSTLLYHPVPLKVKRVRKKEGKQHKGVGNIFSGKWSKKIVRYCGVVIKRRQFSIASFTTRGNSLHSDKYIRKIVTLDLGIKQTDVSFYRNIYEQSSYILSDFLSICGKSSWRTEWNLSVCKARPTVKELVGCRWPWLTYMQQQLIEKKWSSFSETLLGSRIFFKTAPYILFPQAEDSGMPVSFSFLYTTPSYLYHEPWQFQ